MRDAITIIIVILIILGLFYVGERIVEETKKDPNESTPVLVGRGISDAGKDAGKTIIGAIDQLTSNKTEESIEEKVESDNETEKNVTEINIKSME